VVGARLYSGRGRCDTRRPSRAPVRCRTSGISWHYPFGPKIYGTEGLGEAHSVATNSTAAGRRMNRRIVITFKRT